MASVILEHIYVAIYTNYVNFVIRPAERLIFLQLTHLERNLSVKYILKVIF